jgi:hypothetical protein
VADKVRDKVGGRGFAEGLRPSLCCLGLLRFKQAPLNC